ncbi:MAG: hypothetical protein JSV20_05610 [Candidatus Bathyarchaeota archaeon]|nr:MAG: hypothetical protein JSV20_05610 [Candidatus Bathyarchaeota archaeon]
MEAINAQFKEIARKKGFQNLKDVWRSFSPKLTTSERQSLVLALSNDHPWIWEAVLDDFLSTEDVELCLPVLSQVIAKTGVGIGLNRFRQRCREDVNYAKQRALLHDKN